MMTEGKQKKVVAVLETQGKEGPLTLSKSRFGNWVLDGEIQYTALVPERLTTDEPWHVRRYARSPSKLLQRYELPHEDIATTYDIFETSAAEFAEEPFLGTRAKCKNGKLGSYTWLSYGQAAKIRTAIGSGLRHFGLHRGSKVGICSANCKDWVLVDIACHSFSMITVPLYDTLGPDAVEYIVGHAGVEAIACSSDTMKSIMDVIPRCPHVKLVIVYGWDSQMDLPSQTLSSIGSSVSVLTMEELQEIGSTHPAEHDPPHEDDLALFSYTSGTTGPPKGAMISHANLVVSGVMQVITGENKVRSSDVHISYLPLAHIYERANVIALTHAGAAIGFFSGNVLNLMDDMQELKPTVFTSVPRLYNRIYDQITAAIRNASYISRTLFETAYAYKLAALQQGDLSGGRLGPFWDRMVFSTIRAKLGGRVRMMYSGSAPLGKTVMDFMRVCFGVYLIEGYGLTETTSMVSCTLCEETRAGHVGGVGPCCEVKLVDIPEMNYMAANQKGEICVRGPTIFKGYYKDEEKTKEAIDEDGWFHTGDVGAWLSGGRLQIIDRKKAIFKLSHGEYIAAEKIENVLVRSKFVAQAFVYGDSLRSDLVAVIVPDPEVLLPWASSRDLPGTLNEICEHTAANQAVLESVTEEGKQAQLRGFEQVAAVYLHPEPFSLANNLVTPTFKLKRPEAKKLFSEPIAAMYQNLQ